MAKLGLAILVIPQKTWEMIEQELGTYRRIYRETNGSDASPTIAAGWTFCDEDEARAREMAVEWIGGYWQTALRHYEIGGAAAISRSSRVITSARCTAWGPSTPSAGQVTWSEGSPVAWARSTRAANEAACGSADRRAAS